MCCVEGGCEFTVLRVRARYEKMQIEMVRERLPAVRDTSVKRIYFGKQIQVHFSKDPHRSIESA